MGLSRHFGFFTVFSIIAALPAGHACAASIASHRAYYTLETKRVSKDSGIASISGRLAYEIKGSDCEGYAVSYRMANRFSRGEGSASEESDFRSTSFESADGLSLEVKEQQFRDGDQQEDISTSLTRKTRHGEAKGEISGKDSKTFALAADVMLPTEFQKHLVDAAVSGASRDQSDVFEDTSSGTALRAISFIGQRKTGLKVADASDSATAAALEKLAYWPVTTSYFQLDAAGDAEPEYQASFNMLENGISTDLVLDYGSYALTGKLSKVEIFKTDACQ